MTPAARQPCTCTVACQPCAACRAWGDERRLRVKRETRLPVAEIRRRGLTDAYQPGATTALYVPLGPLEVAWL